MLCAIPARGGSKRLARKNLRTLAGMPLIVHSIDVARRSGLFDQVYVCTEDQEIADVARAHGATVPIMMPGELCGDLVASHIPCQYLARHLSSEGRAIDTLVCLQPTSPLRSVDDLTGAVEKFQEGELDFLVSVTPVDPHDFHWAVVPNGNGYWRMYFGDEYLKERPLLPPVFRPNGSIKIARLAALERVGHFFGERMGVIETPPERSVHVALEFDLKLCELLLAGRAA
jgi:N-acylneuraminate cytidylyltransferase/CMP-N,N'-diacetyllegionaminic acid synthase